MESADAGVVAGDGTAPNVNGFINKLTDPTNPSVESTFADYASARAGLVDGRYAQSEDDVRILVGASSYAHASWNLSNRFRYIRFVPSESACIAAHSSGCQH